MDTVLNKSDMVPDLTGPTGWKGRRTTRQAITGQCDLFNEASSPDVVKGGEGEGTTQTGIPEN